MRSLTHHILRTRPIPPRNPRPPSRSLHPLRLFSTTFPLQSSPTIPYTPACPPSTCSCTPTPPGLDIDHKSPLLHTMPFYTSHVVVSTGKQDWTNRIEDEETPAGDFIRGLKGVVGRGGEMFDPFNNILISASSFPSTTATTTPQTILHLFPHFLSLALPTPSTPLLKTLTSSLLAAPTLHPMHNSLPAQAQTLLTRNPSLITTLPTPPSPLKTPTILICSHNTRDTRCGVLGPLLATEFESVLARTDIDAQVGMISHIGGHKFAGNVIVYIPPGWRDEDGSESGVAGMGIWYGRVGVENVEGLVRETLQRGRVVGELLRGGIVADRDGKGGAASLAGMVEEQVARERGEDGGLRLKARARR
ncbi:Sucrase/ferredoxin-like-domain-containing protein [Dendryphion nanum]|uniref:Altered inheritance of mitochondria protein 32 n=1 Tax=Dendryphion nanum TaxID=256645 RepID=A0A9P9DV33_9PLEO|nr:Sucrase/ferredoxin-like-domain-containing protein [Dendryphion nanum]